jgi:hypothetical protein
VNALGKGLLIGAVQVALVLAVGGKLFYDRAALPRAWVETAGFDPVLPIRGRYVALNLLFEAAPESATIPAGEDTASGTLVVRGEAARVVLERDPVGERPRGPLQFMRRDTPDGERWMLVRPVAFFLPEHAPDPTRGAEPGELWMEVTVPRRSLPRPIRLRRSGGE